MVSSVGWRAMFIILGSLGIVWAILWWNIFRDKPGTSRHVSTEELDHIKDELVTEKVVAHTAVEHKTTWRFMLTNRAFIANNYAFFTFGYLLFFAVTWLPGYLEQTYAINVREVGWFLVLPWLLATILLIAGGWISDHLWRKTKHIRTARSHIIWICQIASALCFIPVILTHSLPVAIAGISLGVGLGLMPNAAFYALNADLARDRAATSLGLMNFSFALAGILAPLVTGFLSDITGNFAGAISLLVILTLTSALGIILFHYPDEVLARKTSYH
jgi:nitrate/nitrite transporter NarK